MGEPSQPNRLGVSDLLSAVDSSVRKVDASALRGEVRVLKKSQLKRIIEGLLEMYGSASKQQLMDRREQLKALVDQGQQRNGELQQLLDGGQDGLTKLGGRNQEMDRVLEQIRAEGEKALEQARARLAPYEQEIQSAHALLEAVRADQEKLKGVITAKQQEVAEFEKDLEKDPARARIRPLESKVQSLKDLRHTVMVALDYFTIEEVWDEASYATAYADVGREIGPIGQKLAGDQAKTAKAVEFRDWLVALHEQTQAGQEGLKELIGQMNDGEADMEMVMRIIAKNRDLAAAKDRLQILAASLALLAG